MPVKMNFLINKFKSPQFKEFINYGFWGFITTLVNIGSFQLLYYIGLDYRIANLITIIITKSFAYLVNKYFVFKSRCANRKELLNEVVRFMLSRGFTGLIDYFGLILLVQYLIINPQIGKIITVITVVIINYALGKFIVYKGKNSSDN